MSEIPEHSLINIFYEELSLGVCIVDCDMNIRHWNKWLQHMTGISDADIQGKNLLEKFPAIKSRGKDKYLQECLEKHRTVILSPFFHKYFLPIQIAKKGQKMFMLQKTILYPVVENGKMTGVIIVIEDLSEQILHEKEIDRLNRILRGIRNINRAITSARSELSLLREVCKILVAEMGYLFAWVGYKQKNSPEVEHVAWYGINDEIMAQIKVTWDDSRYANGVAGDAIKSGKIQVSNAIFAEQRSKPWIPVAKATGSKAVCAIPLIVEDEVIGILAVDSCESNVFEDEEVRLLDEMGKDVSFGIKALRDEKKRREAERKLIGSAREWRQTFDAISDCVILLDTDQRILRSNRSFANLLKKDFSEILGRKCYQLVHTMDTPMKDCPYVRMVNSKTTETFEMNIGERWYQVTVDPIIDEKKQLIGAVHVMKDITEMKNDEFQLRKTLEERGLLLQEIHHRVKNNLAVVVSLLNIQSRRIKNTEEALAAFKESITRIHSMALVHEKLYHSHTLSQIEMNEFVPALVRNLYITYNITGSKISLQTDFDEIALGIDQGVPVGLLFNELISNSLKHAFPEGKNGTIVVRMKKEPDNMCLIQVIDDGIGIADNIDFETSESLGMHLIRLLADQIEGEVSLERHPKTAFTVRFRIK